MVRRNKRQILSRYDLYKTYAPSSIVEKHGKNQKNKKYWINPYQSSKWNFVMYVNCRGIAYRRLLVNRSVVDLNISKAAYLKRHIDQSLANSYWHCQPMNALTIVGHCCCPITAFVMNVRNNTCDTVFLFVCSKITTKSNAWPSYAIECDDYILFAPS